MIDQYKNQKAEVNWPFIAIIFIFVALAMASLVQICITEPAYDHRLEGCLEWCRSHGDHKTAADYLACADQCEEALDAR